MRFELVILMALLFVVMVGGCALAEKYVPKKQAEVDGALIYQTPDGAVTTDPVAEDGTPNQPVMVFDDQRAEVLASLGADRVNALVPAPFDQLVYLLFTGGIAGLGYFLRRENKKKLESLGLSRELINSIERNPTVHDIVVEELSSKHSPELKKLVREITEG
jgi:hypothetical protein